MHDSMSKSVTPVPLSPNSVPPALAKTLHPHSGAQWASTPELAAAIAKSEAENAPFDPSYFGGAKSSSPAIRAMAAQQGADFGDPNNHDVQPYTQDHGFAGLDYMFPDGPYNERYTVEALGDPYAQEGRKRRSRSKSAWSQQDLLLMGAVGLFVFALYTNASLYGL